MKRIVSLMILLTVCWALPGAVLAAEPVGSVTFVTGVADITRPGQDAEPLVKGDDIYVGDIVRTKSNAKVEITFIDESIVRVAQKSRLQITEYMFEREERRSTLSLFRGKIQSLVKKLAGFSFGQARKNRFEIHTPTAVCGVRGTDFFTWFMNGETGTAFKEGQGYIYPANNPALSQNVDTNEAGYVVDPDQAPVVKPATDADLEQHLEDTMPTEGDETGDGGDDPGAGLTMDGGDTGDTGDTGDSGDTGGLATDDKVLLDLRDATTVTGITLFSGEAAVGFLTDGWLDGEIDDETNQGAMTLTGTSTDIWPGDTTLGTVGGSLASPDNTQVGGFDGQVAGVGGSWNGLMVSLYAQEPVEPAGSLYDVGYLYGALSSSQDLTSPGTAFSAGGTAYRSSPLGQVSLEPYTDPETGETEPLEDVLAGATTSGAFPGPMIDANMTAGGPISGYSAPMTTLETTSGRILGVYTARYTNADYTNPDGLGQWTSIYGLPGYGGGSYVLGSLSVTDDAAGAPTSYGHLSIGGNATYIDSNYLGNVNLWGRGTYDNGEIDNHHLVVAGAMTLDPLAYSGDWGGGAIAASVYENAGGSFSTLAHDVGIIGGRSPGELVVYGSFGGLGASFLPDRKYLYNTELNASGDTLMLTGVSAGFWKMQDASAYGPTQINYGLINGEAVALYGNPSTNEIGLAASKDLAGRFYPRVANPEMEETYENIEMFNLVGSWGYSAPEDGASYPYLESAGAMAKASLAGDFNGSGSIAGGLDSGYTSYFYGEGGSPGWGIYSIKLGAGIDNLADRPTDGTAWSAKLGGKADFGTGTLGYFLSDASGTWTLEEHAEITGTVLGTYLTETHAGQLTGPFYGTVLGQGEMLWIGQSVGIFEPTQTLDYSGTWGLAGTLYDNISAPGVISTAGSDAGIIGFVQGSDFSYWAMGDYIDTLGLGAGVPYMQNSEIYATAVNPDTTGGIGQLKGYSAGIVAPPGGSAAGQMQSRIELVYFDQTGDMGFASGDMNAPTYPHLELWSGQGNLTRQSMLASVGGSSDPVNLTYGLGSLSAIGLAGDFGGTGSIDATGVSANTIYLYELLETEQTRSMPFGVYEFSVESSTTPSTGKPTGDSPWWAAVGGSGPMDNYGNGYWLAEVGGTWSGDGIVDGSLSGRYVTPLQMGDLSGDFSGLSQPEGGWIGQSVGKYTGDRVDYSGYWGNWPSTLHYNDMGHMLFAGEEWGYFGIKEYADHTEFLAVGEYDEDDLVSGKKMLWNSYLGGEQLLDGTGADDEWGVGTIADGFTAGFWLRDSETASTGTLDGDGWLLVLDAYGNGNIRKTDLAGRFFDLPGTSGDGMWYAESNNVSMLYPDVDEQYKTGISGATAAVRNIGVGAMAGDFAGDGFSGFGGDILPDSKVLFLTHSTKGDLPWGVYNMKLGAGGMFTRRPEGNASWSGVIAGGDAFFDDGSGDGGIFVASADGTWNDAGEIVGKIGTEITAGVGKYMTSYQVGGFSDTGGGIGGDFTGINSSEGTWIGQSVGSFSGSLLSLSGQFDGQNWETWGYGGYGGFTWDGTHTDGLVGTISDPVVGSETSFYVIGHTTANAPIMSVATDIHADASGKHYFTLLDFYSDSSTLAGYSVGIYGDPNTDDFGYTSFSGLSGTHYGKVPVFDAEGTIALQGPIAGYLYTPDEIGAPMIYNYQVIDEGNSLYSEAGTFLNGSIRGERYSFSSDPGAPGVHRTFALGSFYDEVTLSETWWALNSIGRYEISTDVDYISDGSRGELYYLALDFESEGGVFGRLGGELGGSPNGTLQLAGTPVEKNLLGWMYWGGEGAMSLHHYSDLPVGHDTGIFAGYDDGGQIKYMAMGDFYVDPNYSVVTGNELLWASDLREGSNMQGFTGGVWSGGTMDGKAFAAIDMGEGMGAGILLADVRGNYYEYYDDNGISTNSGGWMASGETAWIPMTSVPVSGVMDGGYSPMTGYGQSYDPVNGSASLTASGEIGSTNFLGLDEIWGVWGGYFYGDQSTTTADFSNWHLSLSEDLISPTQSWVEASGGRKPGEDRIIEGRAAGAWVDLENAMTGILGGPVKGTFDPNSLEVPAWQAVVGGAFMETGKFLDMVQENPGYLDQLMIPRFEVGRTDLSWADSAGERLTSVNMNDVVFLSHSTGASPSIWATQNVSGTYNNLPIGGLEPDSVSLSGPGFSNVTFTVNNFGTVESPNNWGALINGAGTVPGTTHNVQIDGGAAGTFGSNSFIGTGAGVAKPAGE